MTAEKLEKRAVIKALDHTEHCVVNYHRLACICGLEWRIKLQAEQIAHADSRKRAEDAEAVLAGLLETWEAADEERLKESDEAHTEASKWRAEGDMYGWNFHEGRSSGTTSASIIFDRVRRQLEAVLTSNRRFDLEVALAGR